MVCVGPDPGFPRKSLSQNAQVFQEMTFLDRRFWQAAEGHVVQERDSQAGLIQVEGFEDPN